MEVWQWTYLVPKCILVTSHLKVRRRPPWTLFPHKQEDGSQQLPKEIFWNKRWGNQAYNLIPACKHALMYIMVLILKFVLRQSSIRVHRSEDRREIWLLKEAFLSITTEQYREEPLIISAFSIIKATWKQNGIKLLHYKFVALVDLKPQFST